jgi:hypothetical protein
VFVTTLGAADDLENEPIRRLLVNGALWATGMDDKIPARGDVALTDVYSPHSFLSEVYTAGLKPSDLTLGAKR